MKITLNLVPWHRVALDKLVFGQLTKNCLHLQNSKTVIYLLFCMGMKRGLLPCEENMY
jgi:hypothetical protein